MNKKLKVAIIGSGISGLSCAWLLSKQHNVTIYEKNDYLGGHSNTQTIQTFGDNKHINVDTGFIVFNEQNYENLNALFNILNVKTYSTDMSFAVSMQNGQFEYGGENLSTLFAQKKNLFKLDFWLMLFDIIRFYKQAEKDINKFNDKTLQEYLNEKSYSSSFIKNHLYPMAASIWSAPINEIKNFPFKNFINFFKNHGLLQISNRPKWKTVLNGSREYIKKIVTASNLKIFTSKGIKKISREKGKVYIYDGKKRIYFDHIVLACHSDQALNLIEDPSKEELSYLSKIKYQRNNVWLHSDESFMPKNNLTWSSWNYIDLGSDKTDEKLCVTYWMNKLQNLNTNDQIFVSLNPPKDPEHKKVYKNIKYSHPIFKHETIVGQKGLTSIQGKNNLWFCGAYHGNGFHEDGIKSGLFVAERIGKIKRPW